MNIAQATTNGTSPWRDRFRRMPAAPEVQVRRKSRRPGRAAGDARLLSSQNRPAKTDGRVFQFRRSKPAPGIWDIMIATYHKQCIQHVGWRQKRIGEKAWLQRTRRTGGIGCVAVLLALTACDPVQIVEGSDTHVSVRYDGVMNGLDQATELAKRACAEHGKTARLRQAYHEGLGIGERFAFFDCV